MGRRVYVSVRLDEDIVNYIQVLSDVFNAPKSYIIRQLLKAAKQLHMDGIIEFPELTLNIEKIRELAGKV